MKKPKKSHKTNPKSIRLNKEFLAIALELSGRQTVQELIDYLLHKYVSDNQKCLVAPIDMIDKRPIDDRVFQLSDMEKNFKTEIPDELGIHKPSNTQSMIVGVGLPAFLRPKEEIEPDMPMWKPKPKIEETVKKVDKQVEDFAAKEMERLRAIQERAKKIKTKK